MISEHHQRLLDKASIRLSPIELRLVAEENPVSASRGGMNHLFHHCDVYQGRPGYGVCLTILDKVMEGDERANKDCAEAIANKTCPAIAMRMEELKAGKALFYLDYKKLMELRAIENAKSVEESPIQFGRRKRTDLKFKPTVIHDKDIPVTKTEKPVDSSNELDFHDNIFEKIVNKVLNDD